MTDLDRFRAVILADEDLQSQLGHIEDRAGFIDRAVQAAQACSIALDAEVLGAQIRPNPLGLRRNAYPETVLSSPPPGWLPAQICAHQGRTWVEWAYFGAQRLSEPFFGQSLQAALRRPLNALVRVATTLDALTAPTQAPARAPPSGFIFHMSRCGSTLTAQMLAAIDRYRVVSEAAPIDESVQLCRGSSPPRIDPLKGMIEAFGPRRPGDGARYFVKADCWHTLALPLFRQAFPATPWVFLYRKPEEVMVSQLWRRGVQMVPDFVAPSLYGLDLPDGAPTEDYWARVLAAVCEGALAEPTGGGLFINYDELPTALWTRILPHFGIVPSKDDIQAMAAAAQYDAKAPEMEFHSDIDTKTSAVTQAIRIACERRLHDVYRRLEARNGL